MGGIESASKGGVSFTKNGEESRKEGKNFTKSKSTIMIEGQKRRSRQRRKKDSMTLEEISEKKKGRRYRNQIVQEKIQWERETDVTLTNGRE